MNEEILDEGFYEKAEVSARMWWESRRWKYNKICLIAGVIILLCDILILSISREAEAILFVCSIFIVYVIISNIVYTSSWIIEYLSQYMISWKWSQTIRSLFFNVGIFITIAAPTAITLFFFFILVNKINVE